MSRYIFSDMHGDGYLWNNIKAFIKPEDQLWFLGDAADRGEEGWRIIKEIYNHPQITYIKGNHEQMLADAIEEYHQDGGVMGQQMDLLFYNGGYETFSCWEEDGAKREWATKLRQLPIYIRLEAKDGRPIHLSHAGFSTNQPVPNDHDLIWDRQHIDDNYYDDTCWIIHGHTPVQTLDDESRADPTPFRYGNKIDIDLGSYVSKRTCLFDIDAMKPVMIYHKGVWDDRN